MFASYFLFPHRTSFFPGTVYTDNVESYALYLYMYIYRKAIMYIMHPPVYLSRL